MSREAAHVVVIGAGPGGLTAAMILAARGLRVTVFEQQPHVGGRNSELRLGPYAFDAGPTFLMMKFLLDEVFEESGLRSEDFMTFRRLEPMYRLQFRDLTLEPTSDAAAMRDQLAQVFPGSERGFDRFLQREQERFRRMLPCLQKPYSTLGSMVSADLRRAIPRLSLGRSLFSVLGDYFDDDRLKLSFTFQAKYLGMSPWECPAAFAILSYVEHAFGVYHVMGGLNRITAGLARAAAQKGAVVRTGAPVAQVLVRDGAACGVRLASGEEVAAAAVVLNADFAHAMTHLMPPGALRKYTPARIERMKYSCSTFMLYLGLDTVCDLPHHTIVFADDYRRNVEDIFRRQCLSTDCSIYVRNATVTDPDLAPPGHSALYVLVPVPNCRAAVDWRAETPRFRDLVLDTLRRRTPLGDLRPHIREELLYTPEDWRDRYNVHRGATFNLAHTLGQMLYFRPRNAFEDLDACYLVGGGTHPGSGLPTIFESGRIAANLLCRRFNVPFLSHNLAT